MEKFVDVCIVGVDEVVVQVFGMQCCGVELVQWFVVDEWDGCCVQVGQYGEGISDFCID